MLVWWAPLNVDPPRCGCEHRQRVLYVCGCVEWSAAVRCDVEDRSSRREGLRFALCSQLDVRADTWIILAGPLQQKLA